MVRREAVKDDVLPLSDPIVTTSGEVINELPIAKGTRVWLSVPGYHMCVLLLYKSLFNTDWRQA